MEPVHSLYTWAEHIAALQRYFLKHRLLLWSVQLLTVELGLLRLLNRGHRDL